MARKLTNRTRRSRQRGGIDWNNLKGYIPFSGYIMGDASSSNVDYTSNNYTSTDYAPNPEPVQSVNTAYTTSEVAANSDASGTFGVFGLGGNHHRRHSKNKRGGKNTGYNLHGTLKTPMAKFARFGNTPGLYGGSRRKSRRNKSKSRRSHRKK